MRRGKRRRRKEEGRIKNYHLDELFGRQTARDFGQLAGLFVGVVDAGD
jgi:tetrahydromethanopterin S-methyltransferase subunit G